MDVLKVIFIILEVLVLFNLLIFVHELGHFLAARWRGLKVERFAIWFGKPIWKTNIGGVEYCLGSIPAGGYVSLPQMATMEAIEGKTDSSAEQLPPVSALDKIIVAVAGPLFSFGLAVLFALVVWMVGRPVTEKETTTVIGYVEKNGPADKAGLRAGDRILEVDGKPVTKFGGMGASEMWRVIRSEGDTIPFKVERNGRVLEFQSGFVKEKTKPWQRQGLRQVLIDAAHTAIIGQVYTNSPAAMAGLKVGDKILEIDGRKIVHPAGVGEYIDQERPASVTLKGLRDRKPIEFSVKPQVPVQPPDNKPRLGISWADDGDITLAHPGPIEQIVSSFDAMVSTFGALFAHKSDVKPQHLGGAIKIFSVYYILFQSEEGWRLAIWFSVVLNVNLALLNLLPIPVLDGGHITLALLEAARRKPVKARTIQIIQNACAVALIGFMLYIAFFDVQELPWSRRKEAALPKMEFAPKAETNQ
ncbi:MAG: RIP metalloprotease RseP [Verrucomicrobia bacterium]|nr:MAG: RIP metalloprotease RseP [Verrucomicrobiota bacterium]